MRPTAQGPHLRHVREVLEQLDVGGPALVVLVAKASHQQRLAQVLGVADLHAGVGGGLGWVGGWGGLGGGGGGRWRARHRGHAHMQSRAVATRGSRPCHAAQQRPAPHSGPCMQPPGKARIDGSSGAGQGTRQLGKRRSTHQAEEWT